MASVYACEAPARPANDADSLCIGLADWCCEISADTAAGKERLAEAFRRYRVRPAARPSSWITAAIEPGGTARIRATSHGQPVTFAELTAGPEWQDLVCIPDPSRKLYAVPRLGERPLLEDLGEEFRVLDRSWWPAYVHAAWITLLLRERPFTALHCAVTASDDHALVLVGSSGTGKSTLACALQQQGADYFGDELAFLTAPEHHLYVLQRDLYLRPGGVEALGTPTAGIQWEERKPGDPKCVVTAVSPRRPCPKDRLTFIFMDGFAAKPALEEISGGEAARRLLQGMSHRDPSVLTRLEIAAELADRYPCRRLKAGAPLETAALLLEDVRGL